MKTISPTARAPLLLAVTMLSAFAKVAVGQSPPEITAPAPLNSNAATDDEVDWFPHLATDRSGTWLAVWESLTAFGPTGTDDVLVSRSFDNGRTWTHSRSLDPNAGSDSGWDSFPKVASDQHGSWVAVWQSSNALNGTLGDDRDILVSRSTDNGLSWSTRAALNANAASDTGDDWFPTLANDGKGTWLAVWYSDDDLGGSIGVDFDILVSRSLDGGVTWTAPAPLNTNADSDSGRDDSPDLVTDGHGNWLAVWTSYDSLGGTIGTDGDILVSRSTNNGATWTAPVALNSDAATDGRGDGGPQMATDGDGNWVVVWWWNSGLRHGDILVSRSADNGATWSERLAIGVMVDGYARVAAGDDGNWFVTWISDTGKQSNPPFGFDSDVFVARSTDNGATWTAPVPLNTNAASDDGDDWFFPTPATDGRGNWVAVWGSYDSLGGTIGTDSDILVARFWVTADVPTVSEWSLAVMTLLILTAATVIMTFRRAIAVGR